jgi:hypothetical protein
LRDEDGRVESFPSLAEDVELVDRTLSPDMGDILGIVLLTNDVQATTLTISDCPCTISKPVTVISSVICHTWYVPERISGLENMY